MTTYTPLATTATIDDVGGISYLPVITSAGCVGYRCTRLTDGARSFIYLNPSRSDERGTPDVFVYAGPCANPAFDTPQCFIVPEDFDVTAYGAPAPVEQPSPSATDATVR